MKRLREIEGQSPLLDEAKRLLAAIEPLPASEARMLRVRRELDRPRGLAAVVRRLPALAVAGGLLLFGATAFGAYRLIEAVVARTPAATGPAAGPVPVRARGAVSGRALGAGGAAAAVTTTNTNTNTTTNTTTTTTTTRTATTVTSPSASADTLRPNAARALAREARRHEAAPTSDSELVHRAAVALRRDHDAAYAARLLDRHRALYAGGPLAEEALALQIEAALALANAPRRAALAREYLARYPNGRYREIAERALAEPKP